MIFWYICIYVYRCIFLLKLYVYDCIDRMSVAFWWYVYIYMYFIYAYILDSSVVLAFWWYTCIYIQRNSSRFLAIYDICLCVSVCINFHTTIIWIRSLCWAQEVSNPAFAGSAQVLEAQCEVKALTKSWEHQTLKAWDGTGKTHV